MISNIEEIVAIKIHTISLLHLLIILWYDLDLNIRVLKDLYVVNMNKKETISDLKKILVDNNNYILYNTAFFKANK